jgi:hypothetical protein
MMPALHNYVTVDSDAFLSKPERMEMIFDMCKSVSPVAISALFERLGDDL